MGKYKATCSENINKRSDKNEYQIKKLFNKICSGLTEIYVLFFLCIFPLCMHDKYFDILTFRFELFWKSTFAYGFIFVIIGFLYILCDTLYNEGVVRKKTINKLKRTIGLQKKENKEMPTQNNVSSTKGFSGVIQLKETDIAMISLVILFSISTALSEYPYEAFWGDRGRNQGLLIWLMFFLAYLLVTRFYKFKKWHIGAYMLCASFVCIWGILNFFLLTFGMFENADDNYKYIFVSSIGNINTYTNFTGILFGVSTALFICTDNVRESLFSYIVLVIAGFAQIMGMSDNAILSTGIVLAVVPLILWKNFRNIAKYFGVVSTYFVSMKITSLSTFLGIKTMNDQDPSIQITVAGNVYFTVVIVVAIVFTVSFAILCLKEKNMTNVHKVIRRLKNIWIIFLSLGAAMVVTVLFLANNGIMNELWKPYKNILIFNDSWGTGRGLCWRLGMEYWKNDATFLMKLFGYGPDTFYIITMDRFMNIMQDAGYGMFDSAHNEYFEYFLTVGIFGLMAYLSMLYVVLRKMFFFGNYYPKIIATGILAYAFQAVVNIAIPITTPVFMILMFVGLAACKEMVK